MALIALGVTGGIGAYKAVEVCRGLQQRGHDVVAVMTRSAARFVGPVTFEAITRRRVITSQWRPGMNADIEHVSLADGIDLLLVAPCTANIIGKFANGIADDFLTSLYLATKAPVMLAPAMNTNMLAHEAVQRNLEVLADRGVHFVEPGEGYLACGWIGRGRLAEPSAIVGAAERLLSSRGASLGGRRFLVTAGPTYEDLDPVRYVGNRSSGRMGFAIAAEARRRGAHVTLVAGPTHLAPPPVDKLVRVRSASDMHHAVMHAAADADAIVMAAAVADYAPAERAPGKVAKTDAAFTITLQRTRDILSDLGAMRADLGPAGPVLVGFAAETEDVVPRARAKRVRKKVDLMVANDVSMRDRGFDSETNAVTIVGEDGEQDVPLQGKDRVAAVVLDRIEQLLRTRAAAATRA
jgi:phosphopantothenoylcysteine decarboxylase/phosphopantothenate--cysteine ligase